MSLNCVDVSSRARMNVRDPWAFVWAPWATETQEPPPTSTVSRGSMERMTRFELATLTLARSSIWPAESAPLR
jgi:hypothetical protein